MSTTRVPETDVKSAKARLQVAIFDALRAVVASPKLSFGVATALAVLLGALATWGAGYIGAHAPAVTSTNSTEITVTTPPAPAPVPTDDTAAE